MSGKEIRPKLYSLGCSFFAAREWCCSYWWPWCSRRSWESRGSQGWLRSRGSLALHLLSSILSRSWQRCTSFLMLLRSWSCGWCLASAWSLDGRWLWPQLFPISSPLIQLPREKQHCRIGGKHFLFLTWMKKLLVYGLKFFFFSLWPFFLWRLMYTED